MKFSFKKTLLNIIVAMTYIKSMINAGSSQNGIHRKTFSNTTQLFPLISKVTDGHLQKVFYPIHGLNFSECVNDFFLKNSSQQYERCGNYLLSKVVTTCLPEWSLDNNFFCIRIEKAPLLSKCPEGWVKLGRTCVKDQVRIRETVCKKDFLLIHNKMCERRYYMKPLPLCDEGFFFSSTTFVCEKWETDVTKVLHSLPLSSMDTVKTKRITFPFLTCPSKARFKKKSCVSFSYTRPYYKCEPGRTLDNMKCIKMKKNCLAKNTFPQLCLHSIPPEKKKTAAIARQNCIKNTKDKLTYCCPKAYELYKSDYDVRCIYASGVSQCLTNMGAYYSPDTFCMEESIPAIPFCEQGKYHDQLQLCEITEIEEPHVICPETFQYHNDSKQCVETDEVLSPECDEKKKECSQFVNTSDVKPIEVINETKLLPPNLFYQKHATWTCPPNSIQVKDSQNMKSSHSFVCEKKEQHVPSYQCPDHFHEGIENVCVKQIFTPLLSSCPIGFQLANEECIKISKSAPVTFCSQGFTFTPFFPTKSNETDEKPQAVCVMQLT